jgi:hypothetical protein
MNSIFLLIIISILISLIILFLIILITLKKDKIKQRYLFKKISKVIEINIIMKRITVMLNILLFINPIVLGYLFLLFDKYILKNYSLLLVILIMISEAILAILAYYCWTIESITKVLIESGLDKIKEGKK